MSTDRFFTNGLAPAGGIIGTERIPADLLAGGSEAISPAQLKAYVLADLQLTTDQYSTDNSNSDFTVDASKVAGAPVLCVLNLTGTLVAGANITLPTVSDLIVAINQPFVNQTYLLRILNNSSGAFSWTVLTNTGWNLNGTMTVAQNSFRDFIVQLTNLTAHHASLQNIGSGGN